MIKGAQDRMDGKATSTAGLKAVDKYTVEITLETPFAPFLAGLAVPGCIIYNKKATEAAGEKFGSQPVGTGPYKLNKWTVNSEIVLDANPNYFRGKPAIDQLIIKIVPDADTQRMMFETGKLDIFDLDNATSQIPYFRDNAKWTKQIDSGPRVGTYYYALNQKIEPLNNLKVRQAIQYAIDRAQIIEKLYYNTGSPAKGVLAPGLAGYNPDLPGFAFDQAKAKQLLTEAGYPNGFDVEIWQSTNSPTTLKLNEAVQAMLAQVGIKVTIKQVDSAAWYDARKAGQIPMYTTSWSADYNDPDNFLYTFWGADNTVTRGFNYSNPRVTEILNQCRVVTDPATRYGLYQEAEKIAVYDDAAWVPLFHLNHLFVVQPWAKGFTVSWNGWSDATGLGSYRGVSVDLTLKK
jgi:peptide/nickel transport system substrate-binding protein/oligopeptide transport system substrate-binding protein